MQFVADDFNVRALGLQKLHRSSSNGFTKRIVLTNQIDFLDVFIGGHDVGQGVHLDVRIGIETEVPEVALVVGQCRIHRRIVEEDDLLIRIAAVVLFDCIGDGVGNARRVALSDEADALVDGDLQLNQRFLSGNLVVKGNDLKLLTVQNTALAVDQFFSCELVVRKTLIAG